jgi:hypothetical protein
MYGRDTLRATNREVEIAGNSRLCMTEKVAPSLPQVHCDVVLGLYRAVCCALDTLSRRGREPLGPESASKSTVASVSGGMLCPYP